MLSSTSANQNLTKFICSAVQEEESQGQPFSVWLLSTSFLAWLQEFFAPCKESNPALTNQQTPRIASLFLLTAVYGLPC